TLRTRSLKGPSSAMPAASVGAPAGDGPARSAAGACFPRALYPTWPADTTRLVVAYPRPAGRELFPRVFVPAADLVEKGDAARGRQPVCHRTAETTPQKESSMKYLVAGLATLALAAGPAPAQNGHGNGHGHGPPG